MRRWGLLALAPLLIAAAPIIEDDYPAGAMKRGEEGTVIVSFEVNTSGRVENCVVTGSSGFKSLDNASCPITKRWIFRPATFAGAPIRSFGTQPIRWQIGRTKSASVPAEPAPPQ